MTIISKATDPTKVDRKLIASYTRYCKWAGTFKPVNLEALEGLDVYYHYDDFCFTAGDKIINDFELDADTLDKLFKLAVSTWKAKEQAIRKQRREANDYNK